MSTLSKLRRLVLRQDVSVRESGWVSAEHVLNVLSRLQQQRMA